MGVEKGSINVQIHAVCSFLVRSGANKWSTNSTQWWRHPNDTHHCCVSLFLLSNHHCSRLLLPSCWFIHPHSPLLFLLLFAKKPLIIGVKRSWSLLLWGLRNMSAWLHTSECNHQHKRLSLPKVAAQFSLKGSEKSYWFEFWGPLDRIFMFYPKNRWFDQYHYNFT